MVHIEIHWHTLVHIGIQILVHIAIHWYTLAHIGTHILVHIGTKILVHIGTQIYHRLGVHSTANKRLGEEMYALRLKCHLGMTFELSRARLTDFYWGLCYVVLRVVMSWMHSFYHPEL